MTDELVVGIYESRADADAAKAQLIHEGVPADRIHVEQRTSGTTAPMPAQDRAALHEVEPPPERGFAGVVSRMFSGALLDDRSAPDYAHALRKGHTVLAVCVDSDANRRTASAILGRAGPRVYPLPNAPTGWNEAHRNDPASIGGVDDDPVRPQGLLTDVEGLPVDADEARLRNRPRGRGNR
jgi:hypothetical protein